MYNNLNGFQLSITAEKFLTFAWHFLCRVAGSRIASPPIEYIFEPVDYDALEARFKTVRYNKFAAYLFPDYQQQLE